MADIAPPQLRGAAYGLRQSLDTVGAFLGPLIAVGLMLLWANDLRAVFRVVGIPSTLAGIVWEQFGAPFTFCVGATFGACAIALIAVKEGRPSSL